MTPRGLGSAGDGAGITETRRGISLEGDGEQEIADDEREKVADRPQRTRSRGVACRQVAREIGTKADEAQTKGKQQRNATEEQRCAKHTRVAQVGRVNSPRAIDHIASHSIHRCDGVRRAIHSQRSDGTRPRTGASRERAPRRQRTLVGEKSRRDCDRKGNGGARGYARLACRWMAS